MYERGVSLESMWALAAAPPEGLGQQICEVDLQKGRTFCFVLFLKDPAMPLILPRCGFEALIKHSLWATGAVSPTAVKLRS